MNLPTSGTLQLSGVDVSEGDVILVSDIEAGNLVFIPDAGGTSVIDITFQQFDGAGGLIQSNDNIYPPLTSQTILPSNYGADGGEFTLDFSNDGLDSDGGNLDTGTSSGGPAALEAGNFDTGLAVSLPPPVIPAGAPSGNASVDPESDYGIYVKDQTDSQISTSSLPTVTGTVQSLYDLFIDFSIQPKLSIKLDYALIQWLGWNFGYIKYPMSLSFDGGTFATPSTDSADFGTFDTPLEPARSSYVS